MSEQNRNDQVIDALVTVHQALQGYVSLEKYAAVSDERDAALSRATAAEAALTASRGREAETRTILEGIAACFEAMDRENLWFSRSLRSLAVRDSLRTWADEARAAAASAAGKVETDDERDGWEPNRCPHGHADCCGHHDLEDTPVHARKDCAMSPEERYYASSDEGEIIALRGQIKHWRHLKKYYHHEYDTAREQLAAAVKALVPLVEFAEATIAIDAHYAGGHPHMTTDMARQWPGVCERAQEALRLLAAASTSAETSTAASGAQAEGEGS